VLDEEFGHVLVAMFQYNLLVRDYAIHFMIFDLQNRLNSYVARCSLRFTKGNEQNYQLVPTLFNFG
jgi:hypothetical protein